MKKVIIALVLLVGSFGAMSASADSKFSIGFSIGHHGEVITHFGVSNRHHDRHHDRHHESRHDRRHRLERNRRHFRFGYHYRTTYDRHHHDPYYHHIHGFHHLCDHGHDYH